MKKLSLIALLSAPLLSAVYVPAVQAQQQTEGNWMVRARVLSLEPENKSSAIGGAGASDRVSVEDKVIPEIDISYFFTKNIAAELVLTVPQKHTVYLDGSDIGTFKHLPPSLLVQYHFMPDATFRPYIGAGVNYTIIGSEKLLNDMKLENSSMGFVAQAGFDIKVAQNSYLNFDVKKIQLRSDLTSSAGAHLSTLKLDPLLWGVGFGMKF